MTAFAMTVNERTSQSLAASDFQTLKIWQKIKKKSAALSNNK
jgi:hypothetical protein